MGEFDLPDADSVDKIVAFILGLPIRMLDAALLSVESTGYADTSPLIKLICIFVLAAGGLVLCYRARRYFVAWFVGLYVLLILIVSGSQLVLSVMAIVSPAQFEAQGRIKIFRIKVTEGQAILPGSWSSDNCGDSETAPVTLCGVSGSQLGSKFEISIKSANCGSTIENVQPDPSLPACIVVRERRQGCGYESILGIRNCKGRGWLDYTVAASTTKSELAPLGTKTLDGTVTVQKPLVIDLKPEIGADVQGVVLKYTIALKNAQGEIVTLSDQNPSTDRFAAELVGTDLVIRRNPEQQQAAQTAK